MVTVKSTTNPDANSLKQRHRHVVIEHARDKALAPVSAALERSRRRRIEPSVNLRRDKHIVGRSVEGVSKNKTQRAFHTVTSSTWYSFCLYSSRGG